MSTKGALPSTEATAINSTHQDGGSGHTESDFKIVDFQFTKTAISDARRTLSSFSNWPIVYILDDGADIYIGETGNAERRLLQHIASPSKRHLTKVSIILNRRFNNSACRDLESLLIRLIGGEARYNLLNLNAGISNRNYYQRGEYNDGFRYVFRQLLARGYFRHQIAPIEELETYRLSPFKALNSEQDHVVLNVVDGALRDLRSNRENIAVIQGPPGSGKTTIGIFLVKLLKDLGKLPSADSVQSDSLLTYLVIRDSIRLARDLRIALVVPQQALRSYTRRVFAMIPSLSDVPVLSPFEVAESSTQYDVVVVDEAQRLSQYGAQSHGALTRRFREISAALFGKDDDTINQIDWITKRARHTILMLDPGQSIRPIDLEKDVIEQVIATAQDSNRYSRLQGQMRIQGGQQYVNLVDTLLSDSPHVDTHTIEDYDFRLFDDLKEMHECIQEKDRNRGSSKLVAGFAWPWRSKTDPTLSDIVLDGVALNWSASNLDWISLSASHKLVGSVHVVQGFDLNYVGVIIGNDLRIDPMSGHLVADRSSYYDLKGKANNTLRGQVTTDSKLLRYITNVYRILLTRGMYGTYVYICDPLLRERFRSFIAR